MPLAGTEGGGITPNSEVWGNVTALVEVKGGHCKSMKCDSFEKTFSGWWRGSYSRTLRQVQRNSPTYSRLGCSADQRSRCSPEGQGLGQEDGVLRKDSPESVFNDIEEDDTQRKIDSCMNKTGMKTELCNVAVADWVYITMQSFLITGDESFVEMVTTLIKHAPSGWKPLKPHLIRGKYLDQANAKMKADCKELFKDMEHMTALTIMSDEWW
jgi:hypothetical protein